MCGVVASQAWPVVLSPEARNRWACHSTSWDEPHSTDHRRHDTGEVVSCYTCFWEHHSWLPCKRCYSRAPKGLVRHPRACITSERYTSEQLRILVDGFDGRPRHDTSDRAGHAGFASRLGHVHVDLRNSKQEELQGWGVA